jgi:hypothetical protein
MLAHVCVLRVRPGSSCVSNLGLVVNLPGCARGVETDYLVVGVEAISPPNVSLPKRGFWIEDESPIDMFAKPQV